MRPPSAKRALVRMETAGSYYERSELQIGTWRGIRLLWKLLGNKARSPPDLRLINIPGATDILLS